MPILHINSTHNENYEVCDDSPMDFMHYINAIQLLAPDRNLTTVHIELTQLWEELKTNRKLYEGRNSRAEPYLSARDQAIQGVLLLEAKYQGQGSKPDPLFARILFLIHVRMAAGSANLGQSSNFYPG
jgi:hypothetical protein